MFRTAGRGSAARRGEVLEQDEAEAAALNNLALVERDIGELERALKLTEAALELCAADGDRHREAALEGNLADLHNAAGARTTRCRTSSAQSPSSATSGRTRPRDCRKYGSS